MPEGDEEQHLKFKIQQQQIPILTLENYIPELLFLKNKNIKKNKMDQNGICD